MKRHAFGISLLTVVVLLVGAGIYGNRVGALLEALDPPRLPPPQLAPVAEWSANQNWTPEQAAEFHYKGQGSRTFNMPLSWFLALEKPTDGTFSFLFSERGLFSSPEYLSRFGFVPQSVSEQNPLGLPIGFAAAPYQQLIGIEDSKTAIGLTCAACHTGQLIHDGKRYLVEGGSAMVDLGQLTLAIGAALGQTEVSSKLTVLNGRFDRFARRVLKDRYSEQSVGRLKRDLTSQIAALASQPMGIDVTEGFGRLDALNRIGNQVFAIDPERPENYVNIDAPVNFPHIWTASWFDWVQYDGSIMQPLVRNAGEAMGTSAHTDFFAPPDRGRFSTAIPMRNLVWIEDQLAGKKAPLADHAFSGLHAPDWPEDFGAIDQDKASQGEALYAQHCARCHRPALTSAVEKGGDPANPFWKYFKPISWQDETGTTRQTDDDYLVVKIVHQDYLGTDPGQGRVLADRKVSTTSGRTTTGVKRDDNIGIDANVCVDGGSVGLVTTTIEDSPMLAYPLALGAVVQMGIDQWMKTNGIDKQEENILAGGRPNCLQAGAGYKARPLNGVWATPPYLHNSSVPSVRHLLGNPEDRPDRFLLGDPSFDTQNLGIVVHEVGASEKDYTKDGFFILKTELPGNSNRGHEFTDEKRPGRIGPALSDEEIDSLIEFLKTL